MASKSHISEAKRHYLADTVLGSIDGCVTTFAVVAGATGANFPTVVAIVLGLANLFGDGISMAVSNYEATLSRQSQNSYKHEPITAGAITFISFLISGAIPLIPLMLPIGPHMAFYVSSAIAALVFFSIGCMKGFILDNPIVSSGLKTLLTGGSAAVLAYAVGYGVQSFLGSSVVLL